MSHFGELLRTARKRAKLTQEALAEKVGIDDSYISKMETEDSSRPSREITLKLAEALGVREKTKEWVDFLLEAGVATTEDMEGFTLQAISTPMHATAHPALSIPYLPSSILGEKLEEIERLIATAGLPEDEEEEVAAALVEMTKQFLKLKKDRRKRKEG